MEWEDKVKMIQLGNAMNNSDGSKHEFYDYCLEHMPKFDWQAWEMFFDLVKLIPTEMKNDFSFWRTAWQRIKTLDAGSIKFNFRASARIVLVQTICVNEFKFTAARNPNHI